MFKTHMSEFVAHVRTVLARRSLGWRTPHEKMFHETPDISVFRFPFYCPIWFYTLRNAFPSQKMMAARFLGIERRSGDAFCYIIVTKPDNPDDAWLSGGAGLTGGALSGGGGTVGGGATGLPRFRRLRKELSWAPRQAR